MTKQTTTQAEDNRFADIFLVSILEYVAENFEPEDVFPDNVLESWAETWAGNNGYVKRYE